MAAALAWIEANAGRVVEEAVRICEIPAPTFEEAERAAYVRERLLEGYAVLEHVPGGRDPHLEWQDGWVARRTG